MSTMSTFPPVYPMSENDDNNDNRVHISTSVNSDTQNFHILGPSLLVLTIPNEQSVEIIGTNVYNSYMDTQRKMKIGLIILGCFSALFFVTIVFMLFRKSKN